MIRQFKQSEASVRADSQLESPLITIFAIPKDFEGHIGMIQRNAIRSWAALGADVEIILFGESPDLLAIAEEVGAVAFPIETNDQGTPLLSDAFSKVHQNASGQLLAYFNSDIIVDERFLKATSRLMASDLEEFLAIGQRIDFSMEYEIESADDMAIITDNVSTVMSQAGRDGEPSSIVCKDYFLFTKNLYHNLPNLLVGRGNWDNWMVHSAKKNRVPVVDLTLCAPVIHQQHDHSHVEGGRRSAYVFGHEARTNQKLCRGRHLVSGSTANWKLTPDGLVRQRVPLGAMLRDMPRFLSLMRNLLFLRYFFLVSTLQL